MTSWLDAVLSRILHTVEDGFRDFCTKACYLFSDSIFQLGHSSGKHQIRFSRCERSDDQVCNSTFLTENTLFSWNQSRRSYMLSSNPVVHVFSLSLRFMCYAVSWAPASLEEFLFCQASNTTVVFQIGSLNIEIMNFVLRISLLRDLFQRKLNFHFEMLNGQLGGQIFYKSIFFYGITLR